LNPIIALQEERKQRQREKIKDTILYVGITLAILALTSVWFITSTGGIKKVTPIVQDEPDYSLAYSAVLEEINNPKEIELKGGSTDVYITRSDEKTSRELFNEKIDEYTVYANPFDTVTYQMTPGTSSTRTSYGGNLSLSSEDMQVLYQITEAEAGGEDAKGKRMVAYTILNRVTSSKFPNTVKGVVYQTNSNGVYQYTPLTNGRFYRVTPSESTIEAVNQAVSYYISGIDETYGAEFFMAPTLIGIDTASSETGANWQRNNLVLTTTYGVHEFRRYK
jgi:hypothetical protein